MSNAAADVVKRLIKPISGTGRNLTIDNWYTSVSLVDDLVQNHKISVVGTMRKNKKEIPPCFMDKKRPEYSSQFGFSDRATLVSYVPKKIDLWYLYHHFIQLLKLMNARMKSVNQES